MKELFMELAVSEKESLKKIAILESVVEEEEVTGFEWKIKFAEWVLERGYLLGVQHAMRKCALSDKMYQELSLKKDSAIQEMIERVLEDKPALE